MSEVAAATAELEAPDQVQQQAPVVQVGAQLRAAREAAGLELGALARQLRLGERQVEALEQGEWSRLPGNTFVRGFVRNYARAVHLDAAPLLAQLDRISELVAPSLDLPESTHVAMPNQGRALSKDTLTVAAGLALVLAAVAAYFFLPDQFWVRAPATPVAVTSEPVPTKPAAAEPLFPPPTEAMGGAAGDNSTAQAAASVPEPVASVAPVGSVLPPAQVPASATSSPAPQTAGGVATPAAAGGGATVSFKFERDSWIEVRDKDGNLLTSKLHPAGSTREISGAAPLSLVVGNASHVQLQYKGKAVALEPNAESDVARLTLQ